MDMRDNINNSINNCILEKTDNSNMHHSNFIKRKINHKGFTLQELLIVVAILAILLAIGIPSAIRVQKNLRQKELDAKAESIYVAVQNKITKMKASGDISFLKYSVSGNRVGRINDIPGDAEAEDNIEQGSICYFTSADLASSSSAAARVMTSDIMDDDLLNEHWVIEYNPESAIVYSVFYSEDRANCAEEYVSNYNLYDLSLRYKSNRLSDNARVGYYGGGSATVSSVKTLEPQIKITNAEKLYADITCAMPAGVTATPVFKVEIKDVYGNAYTKYYTYGSETIKDNTAKYEVVRGIEKNGRNYSLNIVLDDLSKSEKRFYNLYGAGSGHNRDTYGKNIDEELVAGSDITITVTVSCPSNYKITQNQSVFATTNSLFDYSAEKNGTTYPNTAFIANSRHLQNLDESSGVNEDIVDNGAVHKSEIYYAVQTSDISFADDDKLTGVWDWYETYKSEFFNGVITDGVNSGYANFKPIVNRALRTYDGGYTQEGEELRYVISGLTESGVTKGGLFEVLGENYDGETQIIRDLVLAGTKIYAKGADSVAAPLAAEVKGKVQIENCQVYLTENDINNKNQTYIWVKAAYAGGLVGKVYQNSTLDILTSGSSTVIGAYTSKTKDEKTIVTPESKVVGGLVGYVYDNAVVRIEKSYADSYMVGEIAGGFIGQTSEQLDTKISVNSSYSAGFVTATKCAAGFGVGAMNAKNCYTILSRLNMEDDIDYYATAVKGTLSGHTYYSAPNYLNTGAYSMKETGKVMQISEFSSGNGSFTLDKMTNNLGGAFESDATDSTPYNLMEQGLLTYTYPVLKDVKHYGDWKAEFQVGALVYYEKYDDGSYGFYGANVETTLNDDGNVVGDGYGVVYLLESASLPAKVEIKLSDYSDSSWTVTGTIDVENAEYYEVASKSNAYKIYPLPKNIVNTEHVSANYYIKAEIKSYANKDIDYYAFNPHFATTRSAKNIIYQTKKSTKIPMLTEGSNVSIRTGRHLYNLSLYYPLYVSSTCKAVFLQERNINYTDYEWDIFTLLTERRQAQRPIGLDEDGNCTEFQAIYDGQCYTISDISFTSEKGFYIGFIAKNNNTIRNVVLKTDYVKGGDKNYRVQREGDIRGKFVYMGVLTGRNNANARIENCAVAGYYLAGSDGTIHAYENSHCYLGGLTGSNAGTIVNSSADVPLIRLSTNYAYVYLAGFAGSNQGTIRNSYTLGAFEVAIIKGGRVEEGGFAAVNTGKIIDCYSTTAFETSGNTTGCYGFAPSGGTVENCYYLDKGSYSYINKFYSFNNDEGVGSGVTKSQLVEMAGTDTATAENSFCHMNTNSTTGGTSYPFRAVVRNSKGEFVHYGDWIDDEELGAVGVFYWEKEEGGSNAGVHLTYLGTEPVKNKTFYKGSSLCYAHDDGGVITSYGYGYFEKTPGTIIEKTFTQCEYSEDIENEEVNAALHAQMSEYTFHAYTTRPSVDVNVGTDDYFCTIQETVYTEKVNTDGTVTTTVGYKRHTNAKWQFKVKTNNTGGNRSYTFFITPFFANAIKMNKPFSTADMTMENGAGLITDYSTDAGTKETNHFEIRSLDQIQYINWRTDTRTALDSDSEGTTPNANYIYECGNTRMYYSQTHDIESDDRNFAPLGRGGRSFKHTYDGHSYVLKNLKIHASKLNTYVGLFGQIGKGTVLENIIMYAEEGKGIIENNFTVYSTYENNKTSYREPTTGALVGMVYSGSSAGASGSTDPATIRNCTASGYDVVFNGNIWNNEAHIAEMYYRYISIGGLCGSVYGSVIENCSAANNIKVTTDVTKNKDDAGNARVDNTRHYREQLGGLVGSIGESPDWEGHNSTITNCYTGGSITPLEGAKSVLSGGIAGNGSACNRYDCLEVMEKSTVRPRANTETYITNCYTYCKVAKSYNDVASCETRPTFNGNDKKHTAYDATKHYYNGYYYIACNILDTTKITNTYYLEYNDMPQASNVIEGSLVPVLGQSMTYSEMADMETENGLLYKLNGSTGSISDYLNDGLNEITEGIYTNVTVKEGKNNIAIDGKFSFPAGAAALEGKNYPFPVIIKQMDPTFNKVVHVHYGSWPILQPYWLEGRSFIDIFKDMNFDGEYADYATKEFYINTNNVDIGIDFLDVSNYVSDNEDIAEIVGARLVTEGEYAGQYAVTIKALKRGTAHISIKDNPDISTTLEVTGDIALITDPKTLEIAVDNEDELNLYAITDKEQEFTKTEGLDVADIDSWPESIVRYEANAHGEWRLTSEEGNLICTASPTYPFKWTITRDGIGEAVVTVKYTYHYGHGRDDDNHDSDITVSIPITVTQSYILNLVNGSNRKQILVRNETTELSGYNTPNRTGYTFLGWYTSKDEDGVKLIEPDGTLVLSVDGFTSSEGFALKDNTNLYAKWTRETTVYVQDEDAANGVFDETASYLVVAVKDDEKLLLGYSNGLTDMNAEISEQDDSYAGYYIDTEEQGPVKIVADIIKSCSNTSFIWTVQEGLLSIGEYAFDEEDFIARLNTSVSTPESTTPQETPENPSEGEETGTETPENPSEGTDPEGIDPEDPKNSGGVIEFIFYKQIRVTEIDFGGK